MPKVWAHLHLTKYRSYLNGRGSSEVISVKVPGQRIRYETELVLVNCDFFVSQKGRQTTLRTGQRNVHAWVIGHTADFDPWLTTDWNRAIYDPWKGDSFVDMKTLKPVHYANRVYMVGKVLYYD